MQLYPAECRKVRFDFIPKPYGDHFASGVFQAGNLIEQLVVDTVYNGVDHPLHIGEVHHPAERRVQFAFHIHDQAVRMPVHSPAFVIRRYIGQEMGRVEGELFENFHKISVEPFFRAGGLLQASKEAAK